MIDKVITTWCPDTCSCEISYSWDRHSSEDDRIHTPETFAGCGDHKGLDVKTGFQTVLEENQRKNTVVNLLAEKFGAKPTDFRFEFDSGRVLKITHSSLASELALEAQAEIDNMHGKGKVVLHG